MNYIIENINNDIKIDEIIDKYKNIVNKNLNKTKEILVLVPNRNIKLIYSKRLNLEINNGLNICTYNSFVQSELIKYWPIVAEICEGINSKNIRPYFISNSLSEYIIYNMVEDKRNLEGYFEDITASNHNISNSILFNINKSLQSNFEFSEIGERIYQSKKNKDNLLKFSYSQMNEIINKYIHMMLENGILDYSISLYLYNNYLMKDNRYLSHLKKSIKYLIVDSLENSTVCEIDFIDTLLQLQTEAYLYINKTKDYANFNNVDMKYIKDKLYSQCELINKENEYVNINSISKHANKIRLNDSYQLHSEMTLGVAEKILELINEGIEARNISIISPINDITLEYELNNILKSHNIEIHNTKKDKKIIDYPYAHALMVACCIYSGQVDILNEEDYINFYSLILDINKIQASKLVRYNSEDNRKIEITKYIEQNKVQGLSIYEFLRRLYLDKLLHLSEGKENISICKKLIEESEKFIEILNKLEVNIAKNKEIIFIESLRNSIKDYYDIREIEEMEYTDCILLTTPYTYISSNINRAVQIWVDISNNTWNMKSEKELSNVHVFKKSYNPNQIFTEDMEEGYKRYYLYNTVYSLLNNCNEVYAYKSEYTVNGYIQESLLYTLLLKLVDKGD